MQLYCATANHFYYWALPFRMSQPQPAMRVRLGNQYWTLRSLCHDRRSLQGLYQSVTQILRTHQPFAASAPWIFCFSRSALCTKFTALFSTRGLGKQQQRLRLLHVRRACLELMGRSLDMIICLSVLICSRSRRVTGGFEYEPFGYGICHPFTTSIVKKCRLAKGLSSQYRVDLDCQSYWPSRLSASIHLKNHLEICRVLVLPGP